MKRLCFSTIALCAVITCVAEPSHGQVVFERIAQSGEVLPGASSLPGFDPIDRVRSNGFRGQNFAPNGNSAGAVTTNTTVDFPDETFYHYGSTDGGESIVALRRQGTFDSLPQLRYGSIGIDNAGSTLYTTTLDQPGKPDSLWRDGMKLFVEGDPIAASAGFGTVYYTGFSSASLTPDGVARWVSGYSTTPGGPTVGSAIFRDTASPTVLLTSGDQIAPGLTTNSDDTPSNLRWSIGGTNFMAMVDVSNDFDTDEVPIINGQALTTANANALMREGDPIPAADGGLANETWAFGSSWSVNEAGDYLLSGSTRINGTGNTVTDLLIYNGEVLYREGDVVDGRLLDGQVNAVTINDRGDRAFLWNTQDATDPNAPVLDTLFLNDEVYLIEGDLIDTTGDGVPDSAIGGFANARQYLTNLTALGGDPLLFAHTTANNRNAIVRQQLPTLEGDYNGDGAVDAADYTVWRDTLGSELLLAADGDGDNIVDLDDYNVWANSVLANSSAVAIPEPTGAFLLALGGAVGGFRRR